MAEPINPVAVFARRLDGWLRLHPQTTVMDLMVKANELAASLGLRIVHCPVPSREDGKWLLDGWQFETVEGDDP
jgi:hypothetical protein